MDVPASPTCARVCQCFAGNLAQQGSIRPRSRRPPSAHFFFLARQLLLEPRMLCVDVDEEAVPLMGRPPSRRGGATAWRHNACAQPRRLDQSLFGFCAVCHVGRAVDC